MITWRGYIDFKSESMAIIFPKDLFPCVGCAACSSAMACIYAAVRDRPDDGWVSLLFAFHPVASYHFLRLSFIFFCCVVVSCSVLSHVQPNTLMVSSLKPIQVPPVGLERVFSLQIKWNEDGIFLFKKKRKICIQPTSDCFNV